MKHLLLLSIVLAAAACGGKSKPSETAGGGGHDDHDSYKGKAWADMSHEEQEEYMEHVVVPHMKEKFVAFDAKYADGFGCATCHVSAEDHSMPNPNLPKLDFTKKPEDYTPEEQRAGKFMMEVVTPEMAKLLGTTPFDPATQQGFGCLNCHTPTDAK